MSDNRLLVPVSDSPTLRQTVEYVTGAALDADGDGYIRFVYVHSPEVSDETIDEVEADIEEVEELLDRLTVWVREDAGGRADELTVETGQVGMDEYLFSPEDVASALMDAAITHDVGRVVLDPEYDPGVGSPLLRPLVVELTGFDGISVEEAPVRTVTRRSPLVVRSTPLQVGALFFVSFVFYQLLAGTLGLFDLVTGAVSATIVAVGLSRVTFNHEPSVDWLRRILRLLVYIPYLIVQIVKANIEVAIVILHPRLPIDPRLTHVNAAVWGSMPVMLLANSITLTPGTLSVRVDGRSLKIHTLIPPAREDLFDGGLERAVRFVFYGRKAMSIPSPVERNDTEILQPPAGDRPGGSKRDGSVSEGDPPDDETDGKDTDDGGNER